jgi:hypothetical protein
MTQNSDSGDAVGDAGPATDSAAYCYPKVKKDLSKLFCTGAKILQFPYEFLGARKMAKEMPKKFCTHAVDVASRVGKNCRVKATMRV